MFASLLDGVSTRANSVLHNGLVHKVALLEIPLFLTSAVGTYVCAGLGRDAFWLAIPFLVGAFVLPMLTGLSVTMRAILTFAWSFTSGAFLGPTIHSFSAELGWQTVLAAYLDSAGIMFACWCVGALSGKNFSGWGRGLLIALLAFIFVGLIQMFVGGSSVVYSLLGMVLFMGFFVYDAYLVATSEDTWDNAFPLAMQVYLSYINFLLNYLIFQGSRKQ